MGTSLSDPGRLQEPDPSADRPGGEGAGWVEPAARAGYTAKGFVYAVVAFLAVRVAVGAGGDTTGSRDALREIATGPFGRVLIGLMAVGLAGYVVWRLVQALLDPERGDEEDDYRRVAMRIFYFGSAVVYGLLAYYAAELVLDASGGAASDSSAGGGGASADGGSGGGSGAEQAAGMAGPTWAPWVMGAFGIGIAVRGGFQFFKAYTASFRDRIRSFELGPVQSGWVLKASRVGLTARGMTFLIMGGFLLYGAITGDTSEARGLEGVLDALRGSPWLLGAMGIGLWGYALYQWVKARYRLIGFST